MLVLQATANKGLCVSSASVGSGTSLDCIPRFLSLFVMWNYLRDFVKGLDCLQIAEEFIVAIFERTRPLNE